MPSPPRRRTAAVLLASAALVVLAAAVAFRWWDRLVEDRLGRWAVNEVAHRTGGAYRLDLGDLSFLPLTGSIAFDSAVVTTDSVRNRRRPSPLPALEWRGRECRVSGLDVPRILFRKSFIAGELGCRRVAARLRLTAAAAGPARSAADSASPPVSMEDIAAPLGLRSFRVGAVSMPALSLAIERPGERGGSSLRLDSARFEAKDVVFDPEGKPRSGAILTADHARLTATGVVFRPDSLIELAIAGLEAGFTDGTLHATGVRHEPSIPESEWVRRVRVRRDRIDFQLDSLEGRGFGWLRFVSAGEIGMRAVDASGLRFDVLTDRRIPRGPPRRHRTPQEVARGRGAALRVDTLNIMGGAIVYRERRPGRERPGRVGFEDVRATVTHLDLPSRGRPLKIAARGKVMGAGVLAVEATVPLHAGDFRYELSGRLGPMPAEAFNGYLSVNEAYQFDGGAIEEITFRQSARGGVARTTLTPRYRDLSVEATGEGGGIVGSLKRTVTEFVADALVVRSHNPADGGDDFRIARTVSRYDPRNTWIQFLWFSLREALMVGLQERPDRDEDGDGKKDRVERPRRSAKP